MSGMRLGPGADLLEAGNERLAVAPEIDVLHVQHLEAGFPHDPGWIERLIGREPSLGNKAHRRGVSEQAGFRIAVDVEFQLANAGIQLDGQRRMPVIQRIGSARIHLAQPDHLVWADARVIAVVGSDDLDLVEPEIRAFLGAHGGAGESQQNDCGPHCDHGSSCFKRPVSGRAESAAPARWK